MNSDRFKNYQEDVKHLVLDFESMERHGDSRYFDVDQMETIIDFYLDTADGDMLEKSVRYGESLFPASNEIRLRRVHLLCFKERYKEALALLNQLEEMEPDNTDVLYALGVVHSALDQPRKAIQCYLQAAQDGYELGLIFSNIADEYAVMSQFAQARNYYRKALKETPNDEHALYELANCYEDDGLNDRWISFYDHFVKEHPYSKVAWFCLGEGYLSVQLYEKAIDAYQYALAIDTTYYFAYLQLSVCYCALGQYYKASSILQESLDYAEDKAYVLFRIADIMKQDNNLVVSNIYYLKALKEDPCYAEAWHALSLNYSMMQDYSAAIDAAKKALKTDMESPLYLTTLALIYADSGDTDNASRIFDLAIPYYSDFEHGWIAYADFLISQGRYQEAIEALSQGLPDCEMVTEFNKRLALCYYHCGMRNMLYNAVRACIYDDPNGEKLLLEYCPELGDDLDVMNIIDSHRQESLSN